MANGLGGNLKVEPIAVLDTLDHLETVVRLDTALEQPETVVEPHVAKEPGRQVEGERSWTGREAYMLEDEPRREDGSVRPASVWTGREIIEDDQNAGPELTTEEWLQKTWFAHDDVRPPSAQSDCRLHILCASCSCWQWHVNGSKRTLERYRFCSTRWPGPRRRAAGLIGLLCLHCALLAAIL